MITKIFTWCILNVRSTLLVFGFVITVVFVPTIKEAISFVNSGYEATKVNEKQDLEIAKIKETSTETKISIQSIERLLKDEFQYRKRKQR